jgi:hypothetical protein
LPEEFALSYSCKVPPSRVKTIHTPFVIKNEEIINYPYKKISLQPINLCTTPKTSLRSLRRLCAFCDPKRTRTNSQIETWTQSALSDAVNAEAGWVFITGHPIKLQRTQYPGNSISIGNYSFNIAEYSF